MNNPDLAREVDPRVRLREMLTKVFYQVCPQGDEDGPPPHTLGHLLILAEQADLTAFRVYLLRALGVCGGADRESQDGMLELARNLREANRQNNDSLEMLDRMLVASIANPENLVNELKTLQMVTLEEWREYLSQHGETPDLIEQFTSIFIFQIDRLPDMMHCPLAREQVPIIIERFVEYLSCFSEVNRSSISQKILNTLESLQHVQTDQKIAEAARATRIIFERRLAELNSQP